MSEKCNSVTDEELPYVVVNTRTGWAHVGYLEDDRTIVGGIVVLRNAKRVDFIGYQTISPLATKGPMNGFIESLSTSFSGEVPKIRLLDATEILFCTPDAAESLRARKLFE